MIPLMMEKNYAPRGWLGMILGTRVWYAFFDSIKEDEQSFEARVDAVAREIGERGKRPAARLTMGTSMDAASDRSRMLGGLGG